MDQTKIDFLFKGEKKQQKYLNNSRSISLKNIDESFESFNKKSSIFS